MSHGEGSQESYPKVEYVNRSTCDDRRMLKSNSIRNRTVETDLKTDNQNMSKLKTFCTSVPLHDAAARADDQCTYGRPPAQCT